MKKTILLSLNALIIAAALADDHAHLPVYLDYPAGRWDDWSWATRDMRNTNPVRSHQFSIRANLSAWSAVRFRHDGLNTSGLHALEFWVHGGTTGGQQFSVMAAVNFVDGPYRPVINYVTIPANQWVRVQIPLSDLGVTPGSPITDLYFIERRGQSVPTFYLDDIRLIRSSVSRSARLTANFNEPLRELTPLMFGMNVATWDWQLTSSSTMTMMKPLGLGVLRYPGGSISNEYDWANNRNRRTGAGYGTNTNQFLTVAHQLGSEKMITVNYGSGTPEEARDWVQYANITRGGNVKYWTIGNECYGTWEYDTKPFRHDAHTYAHFTRDAVLLMKAVDPTIKVGVVGTWLQTDFTQRLSVVNPRTGQSVNGWSPVLLKTLRDLNITPDYYDIHYYPQNPGREDDANLLHSTYEWADILARTRQLLIDYFGKAGASIPITVTENNCVSYSPGKQSTNLVNALYKADSFGQNCILNSDAYVWWDFHNGTEISNNLSPVLYGARNWGDYGILSAGPQGGVGDPLNTPYPTYHAFHLLRRFAAPGDTLVQASSDHPLVSVYAVKNGVNARPRLLIINKARSTTISATIQLRGATSGTRMQMYQYGAMQDQQRKSPVMKRLSASGNLIRVSLPPLSIQVIQM